MTEKDPAATRRTAIMGAALDEVMTVGIDALSVEGIALRAGVEPSVITGQWGDHRVLFIEAATSYAREHFPVPNTGNLRDDLLEYASLLASIPARGWFRRMFALDGDADLSQIRRDYWEVRARDVAPVFQRAAERGELRAGIEPLEAIRMFTTACLFDVIVNDSEVRPEYVAQLVDVFLHGVTR